MERTTIAISKEVKSRLDSLGRKNQSYNDILRKLVSETGEDNNVESK